MSGRKLITGVCTGRKLFREDEIAVKVFDFDNTIYRGESSIDFSFYMIRHNRKILLYVPMILINLVKYKMCLVKKDELEAVIDTFFEGVLDGTEDVPDLIRRFWEGHTHKLNKKILSLIAPDDVIISASPCILLDGIREKLGTENIIGTEVDLAGKRITWLNFGDNKVKRYRDLFGDRTIDAFYTDSFNDRDLMEISEKVFIVRKGKPVRIRLSGKKSCLL